MIFYITGYKKEHIEMAASQYDLIDEVIAYPEADMHPLYQLEEADRIINMHKRGIGRILVLTMNEAIILRLLKRIRQGVIQPNSVIVTQCDKQGNPHTPVINDDGDFEDYWVDGYFDYMDDEIFD